MYISFRKIKEPFFRHSLSFTFTSLSQAACGLGLRQLGLSACRRWRSLASRYGFGGEIFGTERARLVGDGLRTERTFLGFRFSFFVSIFSFRFRILFSVFCFFISFFAFCFSFSAFRFFCIVVLRQASSARRPSFYFNEASFWILSASTYSA